MNIRKVITIGSSIGITLPKHFLTSRGIAPGDVLEVREAGDAVLIRPLKKTKNDHERVTELALNFVDRYRDDLEALADK